MGKDHEKDIKLKIWKESTEMLLGSVDDPAVQPFSIPMVPDELRKWNENAYIPKVVSIGPRYKGATRDLQQMEEIKWRSLKSLLLRTRKPEKALHRCMKFALELDAPVRASYVDKIILDRYELADIMLNDGCFLLEILVNGSKELNEIIPESHIEGHKDRVVRLEEGLTDLILLENQIPLIILKTLAEKNFPKVFVFHRSDEEEELEEDDDDDGVVYTIQKLVRSFLGLSLDSNFNDHAGHFLELVYVSIFENSQVQNNQEIHHSDNVVVTKLTIDDEEPRDVNVKLNRCATKLQAAGVAVTIKTADTDNKPEEDEDIKFNPLIGFNFDIEFNNGKLEIPRLHITERAEARWRNFIAWEHQKMKGNSLSKPLSTYKCKCTMAALLFNGLICCPSDVQLLKDKKVIVNHSNMSNQDLVDFFRSIPKGVDPSIVDFNYVKMFRDLNTYPTTPYATRIPIILWHYLTRIPELVYSIHKFLRKGYNFAAAIITLLTVIQTVYTVLSYHNPKN